MAFNPNIPQANDFISLSQKQILQNFQSFSAQYGQDHIMIDSVDVNRGKHKKISFAEQSSDPTTVADEVALFSKDTSGQPELYLGPESAATVKRITKSGVLSPELILEAAVSFDLAGNIVEVDSGEVDEEGNPIKKDVSYNVSSVTPNNPVPPPHTNFSDSWTVNFTNNISTVDYFWVIGWALLPQVPGIFQRHPVSFHPTNNGTYSSSVTASSLSITGYQTNDNVTPRNSLARCSRLNLFVYTVG